MKGSVETWLLIRGTRGSGELALLTQWTLSKLQETAKDRKPGVLRSMGSQRVRHNWLSDWRTTGKLVDLVLERWNLSHCFYFNQKSRGMISNLDTRNTQGSRKSPWVYANFQDLWRETGLRIDLWSFNLSVIKNDLTSYAYLPNGGTWGWGHIIL